MARTIDCETQSGMYEEVILTVRHHLFPSEKPETTKEEEKDDAEDSFGHTGDEWLKSVMSAEVNASNCLLSIAQQQYVVDYVQLTYFSRKDFGEVRKGSGEVFVKKIEGKKTSIEFYMDKSKPSPVIDFFGRVSTSIPMGAKHFQFSLGASNGMSLFLSGTKNINPGVSDVSMGWLIPVFHEKKDAKPKSKPKAKSKSRSYDGDTIDLSQGYAGIMIAAACGES